MKKLLLFFHIISGVILSQQVSIKPDTLFKSGFQISNQLISKDRDGKLYIAFTGQSGQGSSSKEIYYAVQEADSFNVQQATNNFTEEISSSLFVTDDGKLHLIFLSRDSDGLMQLYYMNNVSGKFSKRIQLTKSPISKIAPKAVMDHRGMIHIVYYTNSFADNQVCYKAFSTNNFSISNEMILCAGQTDNENDADICLDARDKVHIVVKSGTVNEGKLKYFSSTTGILKETSLNLSDNISFPKIICSGKTLNIFYKNINDHRVYRIVKNRNFSSPEAITPEDQDPVGFRNFTNDETERIYFAYENINSAELKDIYLVYLNNGKFSSPLKICSAWDNSMISDLSLTAAGDGILSYVLSSNLRENSGTRANLIYGKFYPFGNALLKTSADVIDFGEQMIDDFYQEKLKIYNSGTTVLKLFSPSVSSPDFSIESFDTLMVLPDSSEDLKVNFHPSDTTDYNAKLVLLTNASNNKILNVTLKGRGLGYPEITSDKDTLFVYKSGEFKDSVMIINTGTKRLEIDSIYVSNPGLKIFKENISLDPGDSIYLPVTLTLKKTNAELSVADTITIYSNDPFNGVRYILVRSMNMAHNEDDSKSEPVTYELYQNYPNPFNPATTISFSISHAAYVSLAVYDALAREIADLADGFFAAGKHNVTFTADDISTGIYYYKLRVKSGEKKAPDYVEVRKMVLIK